MKMMKPLAVAAVALGLVLAAPGLASAAGTVNNATVSTNNANKYKVDVAWQILTSSGPSAVAVNEAAAYATACSGCKDVALAVQIDLVNGTPMNYFDTNRAVSDVRYCVFCDSTAAAYQFVVSLGGQISLSTQGQSDVNAIEGEVNSLAYSGESGFQIQNDLAVLMEQLNSVLQDPSSYNLVQTNHIMAPALFSPMLTPAPTVHVVQTGGTVDRTSNGTSSL